MNPDIISNTLNKMMNAKRVGKTEIVVTKTSKLLIELLKIMKEKKYIDFNLGEDKKTITIKMISLNECKSVKPRYFVGLDEIDKYLRRFLPSRKMGSLIISTNQGLMDHDQAYNKKIGGALIAYFY